jgi:DNA-binding NtrC family response regulator
MHTVLVVDNERSSRSYREALGGDGYAVRCVSDAFTALREIAAGRPKLVIVGSVSPGVSGMELVMMIKSSDSALPVIMYTDSDLYKRSYMAWSADECLIISDDTYPLLEAARKVLLKSRKSGSPARECDTSFLVSLRANTLC